MISKYDTCSHSFNFYLIMYLNFTVCQEQNPNFLSPFSTFTNRTWSDLSRTDIGTINRAEVDYLSLLGHKMILKRQEFVNWVSEVEHSYKRLQENKLPSLFEHQKARKFSPNILLPHLNEFQQLEQMQHLPSLQHVGPVYVQDAGYIRPQPYQYYPMAASAAFSEPSPTPNSYNPFQQTLSRRHSFDVALLDQLNGFSVEPKAQAQESSHDVHIHGSTPLSQFSDPGFHDLFPQSNQFADPTGFSPNYMSDGGMDWARTQSFQQNNGFAPPLSAPMQFNTPSGLPYATGGLAMNYGHHLPHQQPASQQYMYKSHDQYPQLPPRTSSKGQMSEQDLFNAQFLQYHPEDSTQNHPCILPCRVPQVTLSHQT
ncbi:hypothetical protein BC829DRAFT_112569 [Chytridium lagenaria]|nr:hypothetical protein BC829DRAFT_112569 [Chytridium lagenaria]